MHMTHKHYVTAVEWIREHSLLLDDLEEYINIAASIAHESAPQQLSLLNATIVC